MTEGSYSAVASGQLDRIEAGDSRLADDIYEVIEQIFAVPGQARAFSQVIQTQEGPRFRTVVPSRRPMSVFWSMSAEDEPRIEAVFPYSR